MKSLALSLAALGILAFAGAAQAGERCGGTFHDGRTAEVPPPPPPAPTT
ncbi:MAG TPA: hypothetical protein VMY41_15630 [Thermohalobaculum sp.]|nr:hypothetical protein [Thermohalobaculum sp.]